MATTYNGQEYNLDEAMLANFVNAVKLQFPNLPEKNQIGKVEDLLKTFLKTPKDYAKIERQEFVSKQESKINENKAIATLAAKTVKVFKGYGKELSTAKDTLSATDYKVLESGDVRFAIPFESAKSLQLSTVVDLLGFADIKWNTTDDGKTTLIVKGDLPNAKKQKEAYLKAMTDLAAAVSNEIDTNNMSISLDPESGKVVLKDVTQKQAGTHGGGNHTGTVSKGGTVKHRESGQIFTGTHEEIFNAVTNAGIQLPAWAKPSHICGGKVSGFDVIERK